MKGKPKSETAGIRLPTFVSVAQCCAVTGIPRPIVTAAKKAGCPAFGHSRVNLRELLGWLFQKDAEGEDIQDWGVELRRWQAKRQQQFFEERAKTLVSAEEADASLATVAARTMSIIRQRFENELPASMAGLDVGSARILAKRAVDEALLELRKITKP